MSATTHPGTASGCANGSCETGIATAGSTVADDQVLIDTEMLTVEVIQHLEAKYGKAPVPNPWLHEMVRFIVDGTLEVLIDKYDVGEKIG